MKKPKKDETPQRTTPVAVPLPPRGEVGLTRAQIAALLSTTPRTVDRMVGAGQYPRCDFRIPDPLRGEPRWRVSTHDAWVLQRSGVAAVPHEVQAQANQE